MLLEEVSLPLLMDTGAAASLLNASTYHKLFSHLPLQQPCTSLCGYDNSKTVMLGVLRVSVHYGSKHLPSFPFYIIERRANLLGLDLFTSLGFTLRDEKGSDIHHVTSTWQQRSSHHCSTDWAALKHSPIGFWLTLVCRRSYSPCTEFP